MTTDDGITIADKPQSGDDLDTWERIGRLQTMLAEDARMIQHLKGQIHDLTTKIQNHSKYIAPCDGCNGLHHIGADCPIPTD